MNEDIKKDGATARALGKRLLQNPYLKSNQMPSETGESAQEWQAKHDQWELGWRIEDAIRGGK